MGATFVYLYVVHLCIFMYCNLFLNAGEDECCEDRGCDDLDEMDNLLSCTSSEKVCIIIFLPFVGVYAGIPKICFCMFNEKSLALF